MTSRKKHAWILILCTIAIATLIIFQPSYGWRLRAWLGFRNNLQADDQGMTAARNKALLAQLATLQDVAAQLPQNPHHEIRAMVSSRYPFGFKNEILVNAGSNQGVAAGKAVTFQGIFIGSISRSFSDSAAVQTVFDPGFKMPVRVGLKAHDALFVGGAFPKAISIAKDAPIADGDIVYTAAPGFPYGLPVAAVSVTSTSADKLFQEASLKFVYDVNVIQTVLIAR